MFTKKKISAVAHEIGASDQGNRFGGAGFQDFISPKNLERWKPAVGANKIDIIPYNASASHPMVKTNQVNEGECFYSLDIYVHKDIGPAHKNIPCLRQFGQKCPLCEESNRLRNSNRDEDKELSTKLYARRRVVYLVHDLNTGKYGYWDTGFKSVEQKINAAAAFEVDETTGAKIDVMDWEEGKTVRFMGTEKTFNGNKYVEPDGFGFIKRAPLSDEVLDHSIDLSTTLNMVSEEEMERILSGQIVTSNKSQPVAQTEEPTVQESAPSEDPLEPVHTQAPVTTQATTSAPEVKTQPKESQANTCPCGYNFGEADAHDECATCPVWEQCI